MSLSEYYKVARDQNRSQVAGWSTLYYGVFSKVVRENNYTNVAEIGIGYGTHAYNILTTNPQIKTLTLIDPMKWYPNDRFAQDIQSKQSNQNQWDELYSLIQADLALWKDKIRWLRKPSEDVTLSEIPNASFDALFIDGDHSYAAVLRDLQLYWNRVRPGGQILGDDYWMDDVKRAVNDFSTQIGVPYDLLSREDRPDYKIYRFFR